MARIFANLATKANLPLLLTAYGTLVIAFSILVSRSGDGASWAIGEEPSAKFVAWSVAFPCLLVAFGIVALLNRTSSAIERSELIPVPWYVRTVSTVVFIGYVFAYLFRSAVPGPRTVFFCAMITFMAWLVVWPTYLLRKYG
jgi:hypothetical protein